MDPTNIRSKAIKLGLRVTKDVNGSRVKLSDKDIKKRVHAVMKSRASNTKKFIRICRDVLVTAGPIGTVTQSRSTLPPPPPPPPIRKPVINEKRAKLMNELKATLKKRGIAK